jgi:hypothetical protein
MAAAGHYHFSVKAHGKGSLVKAAYLISGRPERPA